MGALWVVFAAALYVLGSAKGAPCDPCDGEPVVDVAPCSPPATPCVSQMIEKVPVGSLVPPAVDACEEAISPVIPPVVGPPLLAPYPPQTILPPYHPPATVGPFLPSPYAPPALNHPYLPPAANPPCSSPAPNPPCHPPADNPCDASPPCDAEGNPLPLPPTPLSFPLPVPPQPLSSNIFSLLSQAQNGDPNLLLSQLTQYLASTLPTSQLQAAAAIIPPPQEPCDAPVEPPPCASPAPIPTHANPPHFLPYPAIQTPVTYLPPSPSSPNYFALSQKYEPAEPTSAPKQPLDLATLAALQKQASLGLIVLPPEIQAQINQADLPDCSPGPLPSVEAAPAPFEMSKFGQASSQLLNPWPRIYDPLRRLYKPPSYY